MEIRRKLILLVCLFSSTLLYSQVVGIKTNILMDVTKTINLGAEVGLTPKTTLDLYVNYNPWKSNDLKMFKMLVFQPEYRYWLCDRFNGHFFGVHLHGGIYQAAGIDMPFGLWKNLKNNRFKGNFLGFGVSYGYQWMLGKHWNAEANIGVGYVRAQYRQYQCATCGERLGKGHKNYVGPTKASLSLIYLF